MANIFLLQKVAKLTSLSNGGTDAFLQTLVLCGTARAKTRAEKNMVVYLAARDQAYRGRGLAGFTVNEMPWKRGPLEFNNQQQFLIAVIDDALARKDWSQLGYSPNVDHFAAILNDLKVMIRDLDSVETFPDLDWEAPEEYPVCETHALLKYARTLGDGCFACLRCEDIAAEDPKNWQNRLSGNATVTLQDVRFLDDEQK